MRKVLGFLTLAMSMLLVGCIEHHVTITLNRDGSGTITEETTLGGQAVAMMEQMAAMGGDAAGDPFGDLADETKARTKATSMGKGVSVAKVEKIDTGGRRGGRVVYAFEDINNVSFRFGDAVTEMSEGMKPPGMEEGKAPEEKPITFVYKDRVLRLANPGAKGDAAGDASADDGELDEQSLMMAKQMMGDMKMSMKLKLPGGIEETTASYVDGDTVVFMDMDMGKLLEDPEKFRAFAKAKPETPAEMREALKGVDGVRIETNEEVTVTLK